MGYFEPLHIRHYLLVDVAGKKFAFDTNEIEGIHTSKNAITNDGIEDMKAAVHIHGKVVPIINLRQKFVLKSNSDIPYFPTIVFLKNKSKSKNYIIGIQVDMIIEIIEVNQLHIKANKYGFTKIKVFNSLSTEFILVIQIADIIEEHESSLLEVGMPN